MKNETVRETSGSRALGRRSVVGSLFFVMPARCSDVRESARKLMSIGRIREVIVTEGSYGFVVRADPDAESGIIGKKISKVVGGVTKIAICHYSYKK